MDIVTYALAKRYTDSKLGSGRFLGYVTNGGSFPTSHSDGSPLVDGDSVKPSATSTFPFTIGSVTFENRLFRAIYDNNQWVTDPGAIQETVETPTTTPEDESLSEAGTNQKLINVENKKAIIELRQFAGVEMKLEVTPILCRKGTTQAIQIKYTAKRNVAEIKAINLLRGDTVLQSQTASVKDGGTYTYSDTISDSAKYYIQVVDIYDKIYKSEAAEVNFVYPCFYGYASNMDGLVELPLSKDMDVEAEYTCEYDKPVFKYSKAMGELTSILAATDGNYYENYLPSFEKTEDGSFYVYILKDSCYLDKYKLKFCRKQ